jgi:hypothetical protein
VRGAASGVLQDRRGADELELHNVPLDDCAEEGNKHVEGDHRVALHAGSFRLGYAYRLINGFGADASYWTSEGSGIDAIIPSVQLRPFLPVGRVALGLTARAGLLIWPQSGGGTGAWTGLALSGGPDARVWLTHELGVQVAGDVTFANGTGPSQPNLVSETAWFGALGAFAGVVYRL